MQIDTSFDFRSDARGPDPDSSSPTLRRYHAQLWSKDLPRGGTLNLRDGPPGRYLVASIGGEERGFSSDSVIQTFSYWKRTRDLIAGFDAAEIAEFDRLSYTIGGMMIWPVGPPSINAARGRSLIIADRFDLTLECIKRHYLALPHPLEAALDGNRWFFALFGDLDGFARFFLLQDLLDRRGDVRFFTGSGDLSSAGVPTERSQYEAFMEASMAFVRARNERIRVESEERGSSS